MGERRRGIWLLVAVAAFAVLAILLLLAWKLTGTTAHSRPLELRTRHWLGNIAEACEGYRDDFSVYPAASSAEELRRILISGQEGVGPYIWPRGKRWQAEARDPWGTGYLYDRSPDGRSFKLGSAGPDRKFGTEDDIFVGEARRAKK